MSQVQTSQPEVPSYADFEDYRSSQGIAVVVRWFMLVAWLTLINYRPSEYNASLITLNAMGGGLVVFNAYVQWRILRGRPVSWQYVLAMSALDLVIITVGLAITSRFKNNFFVFYYPALLGLALVFTRRRIALASAAMVAATYIGISLTMEPRVRYALGEEKILIVRIVCMFAVVVAANLMTRIERGRRRQAVEAERVSMEENVRLQWRAEEAEREIQRERIRISQEIHDGAAQSAYVLSLGLETSSQLAESNPQLQKRLNALHMQSRQALWELRYPINLGPLFEGEGLGQILRNHLDNFQAISSIPTACSISGTERDIPAVTKQKIFSVAHNALTNAYKYAQATSVRVELSYNDRDLDLSIIDNGIGLDTAELKSSSGHGIRNMRRVARELGGSLDVTSSGGNGTTVVLTMPIQEV